MRLDAHMYMFPLYRQIGDVLERLDHMKEVGDDLASGVSTAMWDDYVDCPPAQVTWDALSTSCECAVDNGGHTGSLASTWKTSLA